MAELPEDKVTVQDVFAWYEMQDQLSKLKAKETLLRQRVFKGLFKTPEEGTNTLPLTALYAEAGMPDDGHVLKAAHKLNRNVDKALLTNLTPKIQTEFKGINLDTLIEWKPDLKIGVYRKLTTEEQHMVDQFLTVKPGMPDLEVVLPKPRGGSKDATAA